MHSYRHDTLPDVDADAIPGGDTQSASDRVPEPDPRSADHVDDFDMPLASVLARSCTAAWTEPESPTTSASSESNAWIGLPSSRRYLPLRRSVPGGSDQGEASIAEIGPGAPIWHSLHLSSV